MCQFVSLSQFADLAVLAKGDISGWLDLVFPGTGAQDRATNPYILPMLASFEDRLNLAAFPSDAFANLPLMHERT